MNTIKTKIQIALAAGALSLTAASASVAAADTVGETVIQGQAVQVEHVQYERAELATNKGRQALERRLQNAAERVCGSQDLRHVHSLSRVARNRECYRTAVADAMSQLATPQVAASN